MLAEARFDAKVARSGPDDCWVWLGARDKDGYGVFWFGGGNVRAHRAAYEFAVGEIPAGQQACHRCDNPPCCNPAHIFLGTSRENTADRHSKGRNASGERHGRRTKPWATARGNRNGARTHPGLHAGELNGQAKLTESDVRRIRARRDAGESLMVVSQSEHISRSLVQQITQGKAWRHLWLPQQT